MKIYELLSKRNAWTQNNYAKNTKRRPVMPNDPDACCWCILGALSKCYPDIEENKRVADRLYNHPTIRKAKGLVAWNDSPSRRKSHILALCKELDI